MSVQDTGAAPPRDAAAALALLRWYVEMGVDEAIGETAPNRLLPPEPILATAGIPVGATVTVHGQRNRDPSRYEMKTIQVEYAGKNYNVYPEFVKKVR